MRIYLIVLIVFAFCTLQPEIVSAAEQYLCTTDKATGFSLNKTTREWDNATFKVDDKYIISKPTASDTRFSNAPFVVRLIGQSFLTAACWKGFDSSGLLYCSGVFEEFQFNRNNGRFIMASLSGYVNVGIDYGYFKVTDDTSDTPSIKIGKCSPF